MATHNVSLTERLHQFVEDEIALGKYENASEVVRAALTLLEQQTKRDERELGRLRRAATAGSWERTRAEGIPLRDDRELDAFLEGLDIQPTDP